jgi:hypothetical protein
LSVKQCNFELIAIEFAKQRLIVEFIKAYDRSSSQNGFDEPIEATMWDQQDDDALEQRQNSWPDDYDDQQQQQNQQQNQQQQENSQNISSSNQQQLHQHQHQSNPHSPTNQQQQETQFNQNQQYNNQPLMQQQSAWPNDEIDELQAHAAKQQQHQNEVQNQFNQQQLHKQQQQQDQNNKLQQQQQQDLSTEYAQYGDDDPSFSSFEARSNPSLSFLNDSTGADHCDLNAQSTLEAQPRWRETIDSATGQVQQRLQKALIAESQSDNNELSPTSKQQQQNNTQSQSQQLRTPLDTVAQQLASDSTNVTPLSQKQVRLENGQIVTPSTYFAERSGPLGDINQRNLTEQQRVTFDDRKRQQQQDDENNRRIPKTALFSDNEQNENDAPQFSQHQQHQSSNQDQSKQQKPICTIESDGSMRLISSKITQIHHYWRFTSPLDINELRQRIAPLFENWLSPQLQSQQQQQQHLQQSDKSKQNRVMTHYVSRSHNLPDSVTLSVVETVQQQKQLNNDNNNNYATNQSKPKRWYHEFDHYMSQKLGHKVKSRHLQLEPNEKQHNTS